MYNISLIFNLLIVLIIKLMTMLCVGSAVRGCGHGAGACAGFEGKFMVNLVQGKSPCCCVEWCRYGS